MLILNLMNLIRMININDKQKDIFINENNEIKKINNELKLQVQTSIKNFLIHQQTINILY